MAAAQAAPLASLAAALCGGARVAGPGAYLAAQGSLLAAFALGSGNFLAQVLYNLVVPKRVGLEHS